MKILQQAIKVKRHSRVHVYFNRPCTVYMMTDVNFKRYREGASYKRIGGPQEKSPCEFLAPYDGTWHAVIEKGSHFNPKPIEGRIEVLSPLLVENSFDFLDPKMEFKGSPNMENEVSEADEASVEPKAKKKKTKKSEEGNHEHNTE